MGTRCHREPSTNQVVCEVEDRPTVRAPEPPELLRRPEPAGTPTPTLDLVGGADILGRPRPPLRLPEPEPRVAERPTVRAPERGQPRTSAPPSQSGDVRRPEPEPRVVERPTPARSPLPTPAPTPRPSGRLPEGASGDYAYAVSDAQGEEVAAGRHEENDNVVLDQVASTSVRREGGQVRGAGVHAHIGTLTVRSDEVRDRCGNVRRPWQASLDGPSADGEVSYVNGRFQATGTAGWIQGSVEANDNDCDTDNGYSYRLGAGVGGGAAIRTSLTDEDHDGVPEWGIGFDAEWFSGDLRSEALGRLHQRGFGMIPPPQPAVRPEEPWFLRAERLRRQAAARDPARAVTPATTPGAARSTSGPAPVPASVQPAPACGPAAASSPWWAAPDEAPAPARR